MADYRPEHVRLAQVVSHARKLQKRLFAGDRSEGLTASLRQAEAHLARSTAWALANRPAGSPVRRLAELARKMAELHQHFRGGNRSAAFIAQCRATERMVDQAASDALNGRTRQASLFECPGVSAIADVVNQYSRDREAERDRRPR